MTDENDVRSKKWKVRRRKGRKTEVWAGRLYYTWIL